LDGRRIFEPAVNFAGITANLAQMKTDAQQPNGFYRAPSGANGYHIVLKIDDTFDLYRVNTLVPTPGGCSQTQSGWGTWSISTAGGSETLLGNFVIPANGIIFIEDHVWVNGQINTARVTIASGVFPDNPSTRTSITVNSNLLYTDYFGKDVIALIAQNNFNVGLRSSDVLRIDAALVAQNGRAGRYYYNGSCGTGQFRNQITLYGMIGTNQRYGFAYTDGTGYQTRIIQYDANLRYGPPPSFPLTTDQYETSSWSEVP
jgi:hypothetical protein